MRIFPAEKISGDIIFFICVPKIMIIPSVVHELQSVLDGWMDEWKKQLTEPILEVKGSV